LAAVGIEFINVGDTLDGMNPGYRYDGPATREYGSDSGYQFPLIGLRERMLAKNMNIHKRDSLSMFPKSRQLFVFLGDSWARLNTMGA